MSITVKKSPSFSGTGGLRFTGNSSTTLLAAKQSSVIPWTPAALGATLAAWHETDSLVTLNGATVSSWGDKTIHANHLLQGIVISQPTWVASGSAGVVETDGVNDFMRASVPAETQPMHIFVLAKWISGTGSMIDGGGGAVDTCSVYGTNASCRMYAPTGGAKITIPSVDYHVFEMVFSGAASYYAFNGAALTGPFNVGTAAPAGLLIGSYGNGSGGYIKCRYASIIKCNAKQDDETRAKIYQWMLARKAALWI